MCTLRFQNLNNTYKGFFCHCANENGFNATQINADDYKEGCSSEFGQGRKGKPWPTTIMWASYWNHLLFDNSFPYFLPILFFVFFYSGGRWWWCVLTSKNCLFSQLCIRHQLPTFQICHFIIIHFIFADGSRPERRAWSRKEDDSIVRLVGVHGTKRWAIIAQEVVLRTNICVFRTFSTFVPLPPQ
jgi:hypothetical protein